MLGVLLCNLLHFLVYVGRYTPYLVHVPFAGNGVFFPEGGQFNQGELYDFEEDDFIGGCEEAISRVDSFNKARSLLLSVLIISAGTCLLALSPMVTFLQLCTT